LRVLLPLLAAALIVTPASAQQSKSAGTATVSLTGEGLSVSGQYPTTLCGGPYLLGEGMAYQVRAGDWQITVASETRAGGEVALNLPDGSVQVVATANGPGRQFVRKPKDGGSLVVAEDFQKAEAKLELGSVVGPERARLTVTFECR
jgi:hypothetical protein